MASEKRRTPAMEKTVSTRSREHARGPTTDDPLLSLKQLAAYLGCSLTFARKLMAEGVLPSVKISGIRRSHVNALVERHLEATLRREGRS